MNECEAADWLEQALSSAERLCQRSTVEWLGVQARRIGSQGWCVNVGTWCGYTALALALGGPTVIAVDTFLASDEQTGDRSLQLIQEGLTDTFHHFLFHVAEIPKASGSGVVIPVVGRSLEVVNLFGLHQFDLVFIDGDHSGLSVMSDLLTWSLTLKPGGMLCGHDFGQPAVRDTVERFILNAGWPSATSEADQVWWTRKP